MLHIPALEKLVHELSRLPGIGPKRLTELKKWLADLGLSLRDPAA
jgi:recombinational DNA repair protein RecR